MRNAYSVGQINSYIKNMFTQDYMLRSVYVKGEVSNVKYHSSGHIYFTMKDNTGTLACVMFSGSRKGLNFTLKEGQQIIAGGKIEVYERDGKYQLYAFDITLDGEGRLYEQFEALKKELSELGMFSEMYKQEIPKYIKTLGVVTAPTGAAVRDIINIATRRNPYIQIILYPAKVQGEGAAESIVNGIHALSDMKVDVMIVGRGGGSIEDLWAFNERIVADAIFECEIPIISAVGHETDTTIADFVADLRAPTPSAGAELAVFAIDAFEDKINELKLKLRRELSGSVERKRAKYNLFYMKLQTLSPESMIREKKMQSMTLHDRLDKHMENKLSYARHQLQLYIERLKGLSPLERLNSGYAFVEGSDGKPVVSIDSVNIDDKLLLNLKDGFIRASVDSKEKVDR